MNPLWLFRLVVDVHELARDGLGAVRRGVVDDDDFPVEVTIRGERLEVCVLATVHRDLSCSRFRLNFETHFSVNIFASSHVIIGRFLRSLYVGRRTEYLFACALFNAIVNEVGFLLNLENCSGEFVFCCLRWISRCCRSRINNEMA